MFGGGYIYSGSYLSTVEAYDASLTRTTPIVLSAAKIVGEAVTIGNYALFGGGSDGNAIAAVEAYDTSLTRTIPEALSTARNGLAAATVGNYALFGGGGYGSGPTAIVDAYTIT